MATNDRVIALGSRALLAVVSLLGASLGGAAAVPGNNTSVSEGRSTLGVVAPATRTKVAEQKIKTNTKLKTTGRLAPGTTNTLSPQPLPPGGRQIIWQKKSNPGAAQSLNPQPLPPGGGGEGRSR